jgi:hypothetical protein
LPYRPNGDKNALWCRCNAEMSDSDNTRANPLTNSEPKR